ncbi:Mth938-like domain-containing protein [Roseospirillum parvum]|uniref:Uncharacterized conserved protein, contains Mth938-like domain n=1 Tax=Roseospirillum parvum TaxID=83401 RepID=A0A1G7Y0U7_9PROT|nr:Mth938-like domain-containing protein [Roseospirillum parvum]SDG90069.1 Uncharacterized conserved protein, contains Mth938-like domain [Roseospirillum parvum]
MEITPVAPSGRQVIQAYGDGGFRIAGTDHVGSVVVLAERTLAWPVIAPDAIRAAELVSLLKTGLLKTGGVLDVLLLGTGPRLVRPAPGVTAELKAALGCGLEVMDSAAAARTFNVLLGEGRPAAAALIAV